MDIDTPPTAPPAHQHLTLPTFSSAFPLPFRVLTLIGLAILLWATNVHVLAVLGVDVPQALDIGGQDDAETDDAPEQGRPVPVADVLFDARGEAADGKISFDGYGRSTLGLPIGSRDFGFPPGGRGAGTGGDVVVAEKTGGERVTARTVYRSVYALFVVYTVYVSAGWAFFRLITRPSADEVAALGEVEDAPGQVERERMERYRAVVGVIVVALAAMGFGTGFGWARWKVGERERQSLLRSFRRIIFPPTTHAPFFADVILADILTSFAKVLGDLWVSACQISGGGITKGRVRVGGVHDWVVLAMVSLPYLLRLRQCVHEYLLPSNTSSRPLMNAIKYASAFPVILLSAAQRTVVQQVAENRGVSVEELKQTSGRWFGEHRLFRLWLLAVVVNSMYSFWWDVTNDWGLELLHVQTWFPSSPGLPGTHRRRPGWLARWAGVFRRGNTGPAGGEYELSSALGHQRSPMPPSHLHFRRRSSFTIVPSSSSSGSSTPLASHVRSSSHSSHFSLPPVTTATTPSAITAWFTALPFRTMPNPLLFGLRQRLLFPDPIVYHLFIAIDFILRFTWSLKLSSHLHTVSEIESGVFMMEALELFRRWMWVFLRTEWEVVKKMEARQEETRVRARYEGEGRSAGGEGKSGI